MIHASGQLEAHRINRRRVAFDDQATINATAQVQNASLTDLLSLVGQDFPVTGTLNLQAHAGGMLGDLNGGGNLTLLGGAIEGQPYHSLTAAVTLAGQDINLTKLTLLQDGGTVEGNGTYSLKTKQFLGNLDGTNFELAHFPQPKDPRLSVAGAVKFDAHASGTFDSFSILAGLHMRNLVLGGQPAGALEVIAHTQGNTAYFTAQNSLATAQLKVNGQTQLHDNFDTRANAVLTNLNVAPFLRAFHVQRSAAIRRLGARSTWPVRCASRSSSAETRRSTSSPSLCRASHSRPRGRYAHRCMRACSILPRLTSPDRIPIFRSPARRL